MRTDAKSSHGKCESHDLSVFGLRYLDSGEDNRGLLMAKIAVHDAPFCSGAMYLEGQVAVLALSHPELDLDVDDVVIGDTSVFCFRLSVFAVRGRLALKSENILSGLCKTV